MSRQSLAVRLVARTSASAFTFCAGVALAGGVELQFRSGFEDATCANGIREEAEQCDDGDGDEFDGCTSQCRATGPCDAMAFPGGDRFAIDPASGHCFVSYDDEFTAFPAARQACAAGGGRLATITSSAESQVALQARNPLQNPWIGATDAFQEGAFEWITGEPFAYTNFAPGEPEDNLGLGADCLHLLDPEGRWADTDCDFLGFVVGRLCEYTPVPVPDMPIATNLGWPVPFTSATPLPGDTAIAYRISVPPGTTLDRFGVVALAGAAGSFTLAVYTDVMNAPGALEYAMSTPAPIAMGPIEVDVADGPLTAGNHWLAFRVSGAGTLLGLGTANEPRCIRSLTIPIANPWPSTFGAATCASTTSVFNIYLGTRRLP